MDWPTLSEASAFAKSYVDKACEILGSDQVEEVGEKSEVIAKLGPPAEQATPLYIITAGDEAGERVVYVGMTSAGARFAGGHSAALKLHDPIYAGLSKAVYRCSVTLLLDDDHVALEWVDPLSIAEEILVDVESRLIFALKPELNSKKMGKDCARNKCAIHVQNVIAGKVGSLLHDFIIPQSV